MSARSLVAALAISAIACSSPSNDTAPVSPPPAQDSGPTSPLQTPAITFMQGDRTVTTLQWGEAFSVRVDGVASGSEVTLRASERLLDGDYSNDAVYRADDNGRVDTATQAPVRAAYDGADPDGLWWSMKKAPAKVDLADDYAFRVDAVLDDHVLATGSLGRWYEGKDVVQVNVKDDGLVGVFAAPKDGKKHPVIVAFGGSEGGIEGGADIAAYWSARGYAVLGLAYFASPGLPEYLEEVPLEYFEKAFAWVDKRAEADATRLAVWGASRGGELALLLGATFPRVTAVIADVPSAVSWGAPQAFGPEKASWTYKGQPIAFVPSVTDVEPAQWNIPGGGTAPAYRPTFEASIARAPKDKLDAATFKVESTHGPVLMLGGADDQLWPSCDLAKLAMDRLTGARHASKYHDELVCYPDAGHGATLLPGLPTADSLAIVHPITGEKLALGGTPKGLARAQRDAMKKTDDFLRAALAP